MAILKTVSVDCDRKYDGCAKRITFAVETKTEAKEAALNEGGWSQVMSHQVCPSCVLVIAQREAARRTKVTVPA